MDKMLMIGLYALLEKTDTSPFLAASFLSLLIKDMNFIQSYSTAGFRFNPNLAHPLTQTLPSLYPKPCAPFDLNPAQDLLYPFNNCFWLVAVFSSSCRMVCIAFLFHYTTATSHPLYRYNYILPLFLSLYRYS